MTKDRNWFVWRAVAVVVLLLVLAVGGFAAHRVGWSQGYAAAELAAEGEEAPTPPLAPPGWRGVEFARGGGLLISVFLGLLFFTFIAKLVGFVVWGWMAGPAMSRRAMAGGWGHPWHCRHGPVPPWHAGWYEQAGGSAPAGEDQANAEV